MNPGRQTVSSAEREAESWQQRGTQGGMGGARGRQNAGGSWKSGKPRGTYRSKSGKVQGVGKFIKCGFSSGKWRVKKRSST